jgi:hypothetical protein
MKIKGKWYIYKYKYIFYMNKVSAIYNHSILQGIYINNYVGNSWSEWEERKRVGGV